MTELVTTRRGHQINADLLSAGELKQIKRTRTLTPQEFVRSEEKDFVFLVRDEKTGKRSEVRIEKKKVLKENSDWIIWQFQGLYKTVDNQLIVIRSHSFRRGEFKNYAPNMPEGTVGYSLFALTATIEDNKVIERDSAGYSSFTVKQDAKTAFCEHRKVTLESKGIGAEMMDKMEKSAAAAGATNIKVNSGWSQEDTRRLILKRGYKGDDAGESGIRKLPEAHEDDNVALFHKFPVNPSGRRKYYSERITI